MVQNVQRFVAEIRENLDIKKVSEDLQAAIEGIRDLATSDDLRATLSGANRLINDEDTQQLAARLSATLTDARTALQSVKSLVADADKRIGPVVDELSGAIGKLDDTLAAAESTLRSAEDQLRGDTELSYQLVGTLEEVEAASRSLRVFLDYLERNPEALLRGKREQ